MRGDVLSSISHATWTLSPLARRGRFPTTLGFAGSGAALRRRSGVVPMRKPSEAPKACGISLPAFKGIMGARAVRSVYTTVAGGLSNLLVSSRVAATFGGCCSRRSQHNYGLCSGKAAGLLYPRNKAFGDRSTYGRPVSIVNPYHLH